MGTFAAALAAAALMAGLPRQPVEAQAAVPCTAIADDAERLACYDRALRAPQAPAAPTPAAAGAEAPAASATQAAPPPAVPAPAPAPAVAAPSAVATPAAVPAPSTAAAASAGIVPIVVVSVRALPGRETTFTAQDGSTWVQTDSQRIAGLPETPFDAEIKPGAMGSKFLVPKDRGRAIRVRSGAE